MVENCYSSVPLYKERFDEKIWRSLLCPGIPNPSDDIHKLPFTYKTDLRDNYPFGMIAVPKERLVVNPRLSPPGTTGKRTVVRYHEKRHRRVWAKKERRQSAGRQRRKSDYIRSLVTACLPAA
ncbi:MAG: hypothetical protein ACLT1K_03645 [[Clostridium] leptum]